MPFNQENSFKKKYTYKNDNNDGNDKKRNNIFKKNGVSAFSKIKNKNFPKIIKNNEEVIVFKLPDKEPMGIEIKKEFNAAKVDDFPTLGKKVPLQNAECKTKHNIKTNNVWNFAGKLKDNENNETNTENKDADDFVKEGCISFNLKTKKIIRNKDDQAYIDYLNRNNRNSGDELSGEDGESFTLNNHQKEHENFKKYMNEQKYNRICHRLSELYERHKEEDEKRGYPQDVDIIQSWEMDNYFERLEWEKKWEQMIEDEMNGISNDEEELTDEASDMEY
jgi:hypothetical protein